MPSARPIPGATPWLQRVRIAKKREGFTEREINLAAEWLTCAVGEVAARYPALVLLDFRGAPIDAQLRALGGGINTHGFYYAVAHNRFDLALQRIREIRQRVDELRDAHETAC